MLRTPFAGSEDWTLAICWQEQNLVVNGLLHGASEKERSIIIDHLRDAQDDTCHPMLVPVVLCEMLTDADSNRVKGHASELLGLEFRTNFSDTSNSKSTPEQEFADITQQLNYITSRFAFHEMRTEANIVLVEKIRAHMADLLFAKVVLSGEKKDPTARIFKDFWDNHSKTALLASADRLSTRLDHLESEQRALLLEISCNAKIAQNQLQIVCAKLVKKIKIGS